MERRAGAIRVTHVVHDFEGGGLETLVAAMARGFDRERVATSVISLSGRVGRLGAELSGVLRTLTAVRPIPVVSMALPISLTRAIRSTQAEIVHIHSGVWPKAALAARLAGVRGVVFTEHGREHDDSTTARWLDRQASRLTDVVVSVSTRLHEYLVEQVGIAERRVITIENGVDTERFAPATRDARSAFQIPPDALVVGSVGRLEPVKAYERLLEAVAAVRDRVQSPGGVYVLLCGDGSERQALIDRARTLGLSEVVRLPGWLGDPAEAYRAMDVFVLPSRSEGLSVSLLEALASGVAPLVTPVGANADVLRGALSAQIVDASDPERFANALGDLLVSSGRRSALAAEGRQTVIARFSQERMLERYTELYESLCAGARATRSAPAVGGS